MKVRDGKGKLLAGDAGQPIALLKLVGETREDQDERQTIRAFAEEEVWDFGTENTAISGARDDLTHDDARI